MSTFYCHAELRQRELDHERQKMHWEQRMGAFGNNAGFGPPNNGMGGSPDAETGMNAMGSDETGAGGSPFRMLESCAFLLVCLVLARLLYVV